MLFSVGISSLTSTTEVHGNPSLPVSKSLIFRLYPSLSVNQRKFAVNDLSLAQNSVVNTGLVVVCAKSQKLKGTSLLFTLIYSDFQIIIFP